MELNEPTWNWLKIWLASLLQAMSFANSANIIFLNRANKQGYFQEHDSEDTLQPMENVS